jgi:hypothetical protein
VTVRDVNDSSLLQDARVYLIADSGGDLTPGDVILTGTTDVNGELEEPEFAYTNPQPVTGRVRRSTTGTLYKTSPIAGTITADGLDATVFLIPDE